MVHLQIRDRNLQVKDNGPLEVRGELTAQIGPNLADRKDQKMPKKNRGCPCFHPDYNQNGRLQKCENCTKLSVSEKEIKKEVLKGEMKVKMTQKIPKKARLREDTNLRVFCLKVSILRVKTNLIITLILPSGSIRTMLRRPSLTHVAPSVKSPEVSPLWEERRKEMETL